MDLIRFGQEEKLGDTSVQDFVVVRLSSETEVGKEHIDVVSTSVKRQTGNQERSNQATQRIHLAPEATE